MGQPSASALAAPSSSSSASASASASTPIAIAGTASTARPSTPPRSPNIIPSPRKSSRLAFRDNNASATTLPGPAYDPFAVSPPSTPPPKRKSRKAKGKQPVRAADTHLQVHDDYPSRLAAVSATARQPAANARHSHGLSWNSTTRDSVVDNLLFSLDNFSRGDVSEQEQAESDRRQYLSSLTNQFSFGRPSKQRPRGHTHSSSASDFDRPTMDSSPASKFSLSSKGRRSNSSSNFGFAQAFTSRAKSSAKGRDSTDTQRPVNGNAGAVSPTKEGGSMHHGHGSSVENNRLAWASAKSLSMDSIYAGDGAADSLSILGRGRPVPSVHSKYEGSGNDSDAAPEPFIAAGPRKMLNPTASGPVYVNPADPKSKPSTLRKTTTQTDLRSAMNSPTQPISQEIRNQAADFVKANSMRGTVPSTPVQGHPGPNSGLSSRSRNPSPPRERPGFFKRVFGSSRAVSTPMDRPTSNHIPPETNQRPDALPRSVSQTSGTQPNGDTKHTLESVPPPPPPPTLNKKPSSFFRRRKKSTTEAAVPPVPPVNTALQAARAAEPSPSISSLRKVMDPFLVQNASGALEPPTSNAHDFRPETAVSYVEDSEDPDIFHRGYTPPADGPLNNPLHQLSREQTASSVPPEPEDAQNAKMKIMKRRPEPLANVEARNDMDYLGDPNRTASTNTTHHTNHDAPMVSPLTDVSPNITRSLTPVSRPETPNGRPLASIPRSPEQRSQDMREFSAGTNVSLNMDDESWVVTKPAMLERPPSKRSERLRLQPTASEERLNSSSNAENVSPVEETSRSSVVQHEDFIPGVTHSSTLPDITASLLPTLSIEHGDLPRNVTEPFITTVPEIVDEGAEYRERALKIFNGDEEDVSRYEAAAWLGERNTLSTRTLHAYMQLFNFSGLNILGSLRMLCAKVMLRGETQQFDRIITSLSSRWCECNSKHGFKAQDVVHTIIYSLVLLNTDLHLADIDEKMSRSAYVKNTLPTIRRVVMDAAPNAFDDTLRPATQSLRPTSPWPGADASAPTSPTLGPMEPGVNTDRRESNLSDPVGPRRLSMRPGFGRVDSDNTPDSAMGGPLNTLVSSPWIGSVRAWEGEIEAILKSFYGSIRSEPLPLLGAMLGPLPPGNRNLSVADLHGSLKRTGSVVSRAPSDNMSYRSRQDLRSMTMRWPGKVNRSRPKVYPASTIGSSRTSFDDGSGFWSPAQSSKFSFSKTLTSASVGSFNHYSPMDTFKHSIGFANALSQAIIREETQGNDSETFSVPGGLLEDESLALEGAPWAKEGLVKHKHHMETEGRKAKDRNWTECFAVLGKGKLTLFNFNTSTKSQSLGRKTPFQRAGKAASVTGARVGGGDWMENAEQLDFFILRQTIASTLPPPGYSKTRPHVWALSLPSGAVHLFQVGTPEIAAEFMTAANYWSARLSKEPLAGGVSNIEYGWSDNIVNMALVERKESFPHPPSAMSNRANAHSHSISTDRPRRSSLQSSVRTSFDTGFGSAKAKLPGDKAHVVDWQPPTQSMMASQLMEVDQLKQLTAYVQGQEEELGKHNELKHAIELAFSPRHPNSSKALTNWQRKSDYLLREIVKFRTYIDSLTAAQKAKDEFYAKKAAERPLSPVAKNDSHRDGLDELPSSSTMLGLNSSVFGSMNAARREIHTSG